MSYVLLDDGVMDRLLMVELNSIEFVPFADIEFTIVQSALLNFTVLLAELSEIMADGPVVLSSNVDPSLLTCTVYTEFNLWVESPMLYVKSITGFKFCIVASVEMAKGDTMLFIVFVFVVVTYAFLYNKPLAPRLYVSVILGAAV